MNHLLLKGNLGKDPKVIDLGSSKKMVTFSFCFNGVVKAGETEAIWFECVGYDRVADQVVRLGIQKGSRVIVSGKLGVNKWTNKDGNAVTNPKITIDSIEQIVKLEAPEPAQTVYQSSSVSEIPDLDQIPF